MLELKKQLIAAYLEFSEKCKSENCIECLYADAPLPQCEAFLLSDFLVASGLFTEPAVPGPATDDHNIMEICFRNGENHMRENIKISLQQLSAEIPCVPISQVLKIMEDLR